MKRNISSIHQKNNIELDTSESLEPLESLEPSAKRHANRVMSNQFKSNGNGVYTITVSEANPPHDFIPTYKYKAHTIIITNPERDFYLESLKIVAKIGKLQNGRWVTSSSPYHRPSVLIHLNTDNLIKQTYKNKICYIIPEQYNLSLNLSCDYNIFEIQLFTSGTFTNCYCEAVIPPEFSVNSNSIINPKNIYSSEKFLYDSNPIYSIALPQKFNDVKFTLSINGEIFTENDFKSIDELNRKCLVLMSNSILDREEPTIIPIHRYNISISPENIYSMYLVANRINYVVYMYGCVGPRFLVN